MHSDQFPFLQNPTFHTCNPPKQKSNLCYLYTHWNMEKLPVDNPLKNWIIHTYSPKKIINLPPENMLKTQSVLSLETMLKFMIHATTGCYAQS